MMFRPTHSPGKEWIATLSIIGVIVGLSVLCVGTVGYLLGVYSASAPQRLVPPSEEVLCTMEALQCPDGSFVGRQGPNCSFAPCPEPETSVFQSDWKEYIHPTGSYRFHYPPSWVVTPLKETNATSVTSLSPAHVDTSPTFERDYQIAVVPLWQTLESLVQERLENAQQASVSGALLSPQPTVKIGNLPAVELSYTSDSQDLIDVFAQISSQSAIVFSGPNRDRQTLKAILASFVFISTEPQSKERADN